MKYDIIVVGAGSAGTMTATRASQKGLKVALIDKKLQNNIGLKICGDVVEKYHITFAKQKVGFNYPQGEELQQEVDGLILHPPNRRSTLVLSGQKAFVLDRLLFGQRLLKLAIKSGAILFSNHSFIDFILEEQKITGVKIRSKKTNEFKSLFANVIIDATGSTGALKKKLPENLRKWIEKDINPIDLGYAYRKIINLLGSKQIRNYNYIHVYYIQQLIRGGYAWIFPRGPQSANIGIGGPKSNTSNLKEKFKLFKDTFPEMKKCVIFHEGAGLVPIRRPMDSFVADHFAVVGDAAFQVNPLHGGGIGSSLKAGIILADTIVKANNVKDFSEKSLWLYNLNYNKQIGGDYAALELLRHMISNMSDRALNILINRKIITERDLIKAAKIRSLKIPLLKMIIKVLKGIDIIWALFKMIIMTKKMKQIKDLYKNYPYKPKNIALWRKKVDKVYRRVKMI